MNANTANEGLTPTQELTAMLSLRISFCVLGVIGFATLVGCFVRFWFLFDVSGVAITLGVGISVLALHVMVMSNAVLSGKMNP